MAVIRRAAAGTNPVARQADGLQPAAPATHPAAVAGIELMCPLLKHFCSSQ